MKRLFSGLVLALLLVACALPSSAQAKLTPVRARARHHHAHKATRHHAHRAQRHRV
jgi:hypothetical protein